MSFVDVLRLITSKCLKVQVFVEKQITSYYVRILKRTGFLKMWGFLKKEGFLKKRYFEKVCFLKNVFFEKSGILKKVCFLKKRYFENPYKSLKINTYLGFMTLKQHKNSIFRVYATKTTSKLSNSRVFPRNLKVSRGTTRFVWFFIDFPTISEGDFRRFPINQIN